jgi:hypothetical protein
MQACPASPPFVLAALMLAVICGSAHARVSDAPVRSGGNPNDRLLCTRLADDDVISVPHGYLIGSRNAFVMYEHAAPSHDGRYWLCPVAPDHVLRVPREAL